MKTILIAAPPMPENHAGSQPVCCRRPRLAQHGRVALVNIAQLVAYAETGATGQGVSKTTDQKAGAEIAAVWDYVKEILDG